MQIVVPTSISGRRTGFKDSWVDPIAVYRQGQSAVTFEEKGSKDWELMMPKSRRMLNFTRTEVVEINLGRFPELLGPSFPTARYDRIQIVTLPSQSN